MTKPQIHREPKKLVAKPCKTCGRKVYAGLDGRSVALPVVIDADILTRNGELVFIVTGVKMYGTNRHGEILRRTPNEVLHHIPSLNMHREHDCEHPTPPEFIEPPKAKAVVITSEEVPF